MTILAGVELTHIPPGDIAASAEEARALGAQIIVCHGETLVEPVAPGTNRAALEADIDILSHPGLLTAEEAEELDAALEAVPERLAELAADDVADIEDVHLLVERTKNPAHQVAP